MIGVTLGVTVDSLFLGGTIVDFNKTLEVEAGALFPVKGVMRWMIAGLQFYGLAGLWEWLLPGSIHNLWIEKVWMAIITFMIFSVMKFLFKNFWLTRPYVTYKDLAHLYNEAHWERERNTHA